MSDPSRWILGDLGVWECELHGMALRVRNLDDAEQATDDVDAPEDPEALLYCTRLFGQGLKVTPRS